MSLSQAHISQSNDSSHAPVMCRFLPDDALLLTRPQMLSRSSTSEEPAVMDIVESTAAVMFLGTPHRGSENLAGVGDSVRKVATRVLRMDTNHYNLGALGLLSSELERCQEAFSTLWAKYDFRVKTFQEGQPLTGFNLGLLGEKV